MTGGFFRTIWTAAAAASILASCSRETDSEARVERAWVRLPAAPGVPGAGYFTAALPESNDAIVAISSPAAERVEMHNVVEENGVTRMVPIARAEPDARRGLTFEPGGKHLMLFGLEPELQPGQEIELTFRFSSAEPVTVRAPLIAAGAGAPGVHRER